MPDGSRLSDLAYGSNLGRTAKIMALMGLDPNALLDPNVPPEAQFSAADVFRHLTGSSPQRVATGMQEWQDANWLKVRMGKQLAQKMLNQDQLDKYRTKAKQERERLQGLVDTGDILPWQQPEVLNKVGMYRNVEERLSDPAALKTLSDLARRINRPADMDLIDIPFVTSNITYSR